MCDPFAVIVGAGKAVADPVVTASTNEFMYVWKYKDNIKRVNSLRDNLQAKRNGIEQQVQVGIRKNEVVDEEVGKWMKEVDEFIKISMEDEYKELFLDEIARIKAEQCCLGLCWSPKFRYVWSRKAVEKSDDINQLVDTIVKRAPGPITLPKKHSIGETKSTYFCEHLQSREDNLQKILTVLKNDEVNTVGVYGMGGSGKTTLIRELMKRAYNEKLFDDIMMAEISQFPDIIRIQDEIAECIELPLDRCHTPEARARELSLRLNHILRGKNLNEDDDNDNESHGPGKEIKEDSDKVNQPKHFTKAVTRKDLVKSQSMKGKIDLANEKCQTKDNGKDSKKADQGNEKKCGPINEKDDRGKGKKSDDDEKQCPEKKSVKLLVILDNMWKKLDLQRVGIPYDLEKDMRCKIIVISRSDVVCKAMGASNENIIKVDDLSAQEAEVLFKERVGSNFDHVDYQDITDELLKKCSRLPLSINVLADTLKNQSLLVWKRILKQLENPVPGENIGLMGDTFSIIELSYNYLGSKEKQMFFLLCCLFPPGSSVPIYDVLRYGIGLGLFQYTNSLVEATEQAYKWADELKSLSLFKDVDVVKGDIIIHDDVREAGKSFARKGEHAFHVGAIPKWLKGGSYKKLTAISMVSDNSFEYLGGRKLPKLQLLRSLGICSTKLPDGYFEGRPKLKVLDLSKSDIRSLPSSIQQLRNLKTLLLEYCSLEDVSQICQLHKLQVLSFRESNITSLPKEIALLVQLKLLDLSNCDQLNEIPANALVKLTQLEGLYMKNSFSGWEVGGNMASLLELKLLPLHVLEINVKSIEQLGDEDFPSLDLLSYKIRFAVSNRQKSSFSSSRDLQVGKLQARDLAKEGWKHLVNKAESLYLENIQGLKNVAPYLDQYGLNELKRLKVSQCKKMKCLISGKAIHQSIAFPVLEDLCLAYLPKLENICHGKYPPELFSYLQQLTLHRLDGLRQHALPIQHAARLRILRVDGCSELQYIFSTPTAIQFWVREEAKHNSESELPCLERLHLFDLPALKGLSADISSENDAGQYLFPKKMKFPCLDKLKVGWLPEITEMWDITTGSEFSTVFPKIRSISLIELPQLKHVWSDELCSGSFNFTYLKKLKIRDCSSLESICPPAVAGGLHELQLFRIYFSREVKQFISAVKGIKDCIKFPKLSTLDFMVLPKLTCFYEGQLEINFPELKSLKLDSLNRLKMFCNSNVESPNGRAGTNHHRENSEDDGLLFSGEVVLPLLETLHVESLEEIVTMWDLKNAKDFSRRFPNLQSLSLDSMGSLAHLWNKELCTESHAFSNLKKITVESCNSLRSLYEPASATSTDTQAVDVKFSALQTLRLESLGSFNYFLKGQGNLEFPVLKELELSNLEQMETFADLGSTEGSLFHRKISSPVLEVLQLQNLPIVDKLWDVATSEEFTSAFRRLRQVGIADMPNLTCVWSAEQNEESIYFGSLVNIRIKSCENVECLFSLTSPQRVQYSKMICFPKLNRLELIGLKNLRSLFQGGRLNMEFQALKVLIVKELPMIKVLIRPGKSDFNVGEEKSDGEEVDSGEEEPTISKELDNDPDKDESCITDHAARLTEEKVEDLELDTVLFNGNVEFPSLEELRMKHLPELEHIYDPEDENPVVGGSFFPKLKILHLTGGKESMLNQLPRKMLRKLSSLKISKLRKLKCLVSSGNVVMDEGLLESVSELEQLEELTVKDCYAMEAIVAKVVEGEEEDCHEFIFPQLKTITLSWMSSLDTFSSTSNTLKFPSMESLDIYRCHNIRSFSLTLPEAPKLIEIEVDGEKIPIEQGLDLNTILRRQFDSKHQLVNHWPRARQHKLHEEHELMLIIRNYICNGCSEQGEVYSYCCRRCNFDLHPLCALEEIQIAKDSNEAEALKSWPRTLKHKLHEMHDLKLVTGRSYGCDGCQQVTDDVFSYFCVDCDFDLHPRCALEMKSPEVQEIESSSSWQS